MKSEPYFDKDQNASLTTIRTLSHDGRGIASIDNKTTFVANALPGEEVKYQIIQKHSQYNEAKALSVIRPSSERMNPACPHFGLCGGCNLQHMSNNLQIQFKQQAVLEMLKHFGRVTPETLLLPLQSTALGYRRKARLGVKFVIKKNKLLVGFREKSSRYLADLQSCSVLHPHVGERLMAMRELIQSLEQYHSIPQIEVAMGDHQAALVFRHLQPLSHSDMEKLITFGREYQFHIYLQPNPPENVYKLWPENTPEILSYKLPEYKLEFLFHPLDFTQVNLEINQAMLKQAISLMDLKAHETVLDLFCGIGNFTLCMAQFAKQVTGIEGSAKTVAMAKKNAVHNQVTNVDFYDANLAEVPQKASWIKSYDTLLLDPPRTGAKEILTCINQLSPKKILYVSCNPATFARDTGELVHQQGYKLTQLGVMDMFPHTKHVEVMGLLEKS